MQAVIDNEANPQKWMESLKVFNSTNASTMTFVDKYGKETKRNFFTCLINNLTGETKLKSEDAAVILEAIRLCLRENEEIDTILDPKNIGSILRLANLLNEDSSISPNVSLEALKCLVNITAKIPTATKVFVDQFQGIEKISNKLKNPSVFNGAEAFPIMRIVFHLGLVNAYSDVLNQLNVLEPIVQYLESWVKSQGQINPVVNDCLKVFFKLTIAIGPLDTGKRAQPTDIQQNLFSRMAPVYQYILSMSNSIPTNYTAKLDVVNCLVNTPLTCTQLIASQSNIDSLLDVLTTQILKDNTAEGLTALLLVLHMIAKDVIDARKQMRKKIFPVNLPDQLSVDGPPKDNSLLTKLREHMTSGSITLKQFSQDLVYVLCDENAEEFVRANGYGYSAGFLAEKNLLGSFAHVFAQPQSSSANSGAKSYQDNKSDKKQGNDSSSDSDEEKEAAELAQKIQRLQELGFMKVVHK